MKKLFLESLKALLKDEEDTIANMANSAAALYEELDDVNWVGFYRLRSDELLLGPFIGKVACVHLPAEKGVCWAAVKARNTVIVPDVHQFSTHIACDAATSSEIVIPLFNEDHNIIAVLDIDSPAVNRFSQEDQAFLEEAAHIIAGKIKRI